VDTLCRIVNISRSDGLQLFGLLDRDRLAFPAIVQQTTEETERGPRRYLKFYANDEVSEEVLLCGRT
jgi:hypothetical protein